MKQLGSNIKILRRRQRLTLIDVSKKTGIDPATLSRIENGKMSGTIQSHMVIAKALDVHLPDLYQKALETDDKDTISKRSDASGIFAHGGGSISELLTTNVLNKKMMPVKLKLKPGGRTEIEEYALGTERFVYSLTGRIQIIVKDETHTLKEGESLYFNANLPHYIKNPLKTPSVCLIIATPPAL